MVEEICRRKIEHIKICLEKNVESEETNGFEDIILIHRIPNINYEEIDTSISFFGKRISAPIIISPITGGHELSEKINRNLALAAKELNIPLAVGSQRIALINKEYRKSFEVIREVSEEIFVIANIGIAQLKEFSLDKIQEAIDMIDANAIYIHVNPLQEVLQKEGDKDFSNCLEKIDDIKQLNIPIIVKEVGSGFCMEDARIFEKYGVDAIDVAGLGGTNFAIVEYYRSKSIISKDFFNWGIKTAISLIECLEGTKLKVIASGGIRNGVEVAKAIALGAYAVGIALPILKLAVHSYEDVVKYLRNIIEQLKISMFLTNSKNIEELKKVNLIIKGFVKEWLELRGINVKKYAKRKY